MHFFSNIYANFLLAALVIYALFSTPTPDNLTVAELLIALLLALTFTSSIPAALLPGAKTLAYSPPAVRIAALSLIFVPTGTALIYSLSLIHI